MEFHFFLSGRLVCWRTRRAKIGKILRVTKSRATNTKRNTAQTPKNEGKFVFLVAQIYLAFLPQQYGKITRRKNTSLLSLYIRPKKTFYRFKCVFRPFFSYFFNIFPIHHG
jgi:hypothetical protein